MIRRDIRKKLQRLNRAQHSSPADVPDSRPQRLSQQVPAARMPQSTRQAQEDPTSLKDVVTGEEVTTSSGKFLLIERSTGHFIRDAEKLRATYSFYFEKGGATIDEELGRAELVRFINCGPGKSVFLDIETTGLRGGPLFLAGLLLYREKEFLVRQLLARDYSEEKPLLEYLLALLSEFGVVVTFNGKAFDIPYIRDRSSYNILPFRLKVHHLDLLHEYRRRWKGILPNCRLQTLESRICYRSRMDDISGWDIPRAYHDFVRTGDAREMKSILHHNALDLITMSELVLKLFSSEA